MEDILTTDDLERRRSLSGRLSLESPSASGRNLPVHASSSWRSFQVDGQHNQDNYHTSLTIGPDADQDVELLADVPEESRVIVQWDQISASVPSMFTSPGLLDDFKLKKEERPLRQILFSVSGCCKPGEVLAFMGPSGSGKTSLLSTIGGRSQSAMQTTGEVTFNGAHLGKKLKRQIGFVMQDDLLYESLTVHETLYYAAMLRLPRSLTAQQKRERVGMVIKALGLTSCQNTIIGGFFRKGISGGERKRVSIAEQLLINPSVLLLDEPTSGLDSTTAMHLLTSLRRLATGGRAIITTLHQPSSRLYGLLDKLLLLSKGHAIYYGKAAEADNWFNRLGFQLPYRVNVADFILDLASGDVHNGGRTGEECRTFLIACSEHFLKSHPKDGFDSEVSSGSFVEGIGRWMMEKKKGDDLETVPIRGGFLEPQESVRPESPEPEEAKHENGEKAGPVAAMGVEEGPHNWRQRVAGWVPGKGDGSRWGATYPTQLRILFIRSLRTRRFEAFSAQNLIQFLCIGVLTGLFWWQRAGKSTLAAGTDTIGLLFFELLFPSFRAMFVALFTFPEEFKMLLKERASGMYRLSAFYFARTGSDAPMDVAIPTLFIILIYFMGHLRYTAAAFFANFFTVVLVQLVAQSYGLLLGTVVMNPKTAQTIAAILMLTFVLTGGFFVKGIPVWISWIKYLSFVYYGLNLLSHIEFHGRTFYSCTSTDSSSGTASCTQKDLSSPSTNPQCVPVENLQSSLGLQRDPNGNQAFSALMLLMFLVVIRVLVYVALRRKTASK